MTVPISQIISIILFPLHLSLCFLSFFLFSFTFFGFTKNSKHFKSVERWQNSNMIPKIKVRQHKNEKDFVEHS